MEELEKARVSTSSAHGTSESKRKKVLAHPWWRSEEESVGVAKVVGEAKRTSDRSKSTHGENSFEGESLNRNCNTNLLHTWSLPNITEQGPAIFQMSYLGGPVI